MKKLNQKTYHHGIDKRTIIIMLFFSLLVNPIFAASSSGMPWENQLDKIVRSVVYIATGVAVVALVWAGIQFFSNNVKAAVQSFIGTIIGGSIALGAEFIVKNFITNTGGWLI